MLNFGACKSVVWIAALVLVSRGSDAQQTPRTLQLDDFAKIAAISDPQFSPDGRSIVVVVSRPNMEADRFDRELALIDVATARERKLTSERLGLSSPRWSPTGDRLAFMSVSGNGKEAKVQLFVLPMAGGEPTQITSASNGVEQFAWRPNGTEIAYVTADEPENKADLARHLDGFPAGENDYLSTSAPTPSHVWLTSAEGSRSRRLTSGTWSVPKSANFPAAPVSPLQWSADGKYLLLTRQSTANARDFLERTVQVLDVDAGVMRKLTSHERFEGYPSFSPKSTRIAYWFPEDGNRLKQNQIYLTSLADGDGRELTRDIDRNISRALWMPDGKSLLVAGHDLTGVGMWLKAVSGRTERLDLGEVTPSWLYWVDVAVGLHAEIAFTGSTASHPNELYYLSSPHATPRRLTHLNDAIEALALGNVERLSWHGPDNFVEDGVLTFPPGSTDKAHPQTSKTYPLALYIHGGPRSASTATFSFLPQYMASHGYVVFQPNYRGSDNLGGAYQSAIYASDSDGPARDILAGIDAVKRRAAIDDSRIAVTGSSYGGLLTVWLIGHAQVWKAAVAGEAAADWMDSYDLTDAGAFFGYEMGGSPWIGDRQKKYASESPLTFAPRIRTPTLILHDTGDARVPITSSYALYHALKDNRVEVQFIAYPVAGHTPGDPVRLLDSYRRWTEWLDQHMK